jgi:hypothetical protein
MENNFTNKDFEHFIKENADQYRMFPSEKVWKGINKSLHTRRRWYGFGLGFLLLTTSVVTWVMLTNANRNRPVISRLPEISSAAPVPEIKEPAKIILAPSKPANQSFVTSSEKLQKDIYIPSVETSTPDDYAAISPVFTEEQPAAIYNENNSDLKSEPLFVSEHIASRVTSTPKQAVTNEPVELVVVAKQPDERHVTIPVTDKEKEIAAIKDEINRMRVNDIPWTIESVINSYQYRRNKKKLSWEVYFTPTITYRDLKENKPFIAWSTTQTNGLTNATYNADIDNIVKHKPDLGLQLGFSTGLAVTKKIRLTGGIQFNVSKYDIRAYNTPAEQATVSLSSAAGGRNTLTATSYYRNVGVDPNWLRNLYISASIPVGVEVRLLGNKRNYFGVAGTVQPTYILSDKSFLLTTDYKNYAKFPSLTRKVNVNAGFEMFAGITAGKTRLRIGPQVRYQVMSSYQDRYPIMEHLFDFGLKMGIMLNR